MLIKTINTKRVFGDKEKVLETVMTDKANSHFLYRVFGYVDGFSRGPGRFKRIDKETGEARETSWTKFSGDIRAMNASGETFEASTVFLPDYISDPLANALDKGDDIVAVDIAFDIFAFYSKDSATSFEYVAKPIRPTEEGSVSKLDAMAAALPALPGASSAPQLAAPAKKK